MMKNIIGQLLLIPNTIHDLSFVVGKMYKMIKANNCLTLCELFLCLISQLPKGKVVFCLINSISIYETDQ